MNIQIMGASGAGKTFLGKKLAQELKYKFIDTDELLWLWDDNVQPYTVPISDEESYKKYEKILNNYENTITSGLFYPWSERLIKKIDLMIYLTTPVEIRKKRIIKREFEMFGNRVSRKGDMREQFENFIEWACKYDYHNDKYGSKVESEKWLKKYKCPILYLNGNDDIKKNIQAIIEKIK